MLTAIVTLRVVPGGHDQLEADYRMWSKIVKRDEPGTLLYSLCRSPDDANTYYAVEQYRDEAAMREHVVNWQKRTDAPDVLLEPPAVRVCDTVSD